MSGRRTVSVHWPVAEFFGVGVGLGELSRTNTPDTTLGVVFAECILGTVGNRVKAQ
jgi:hypothetical protein